MIETRVAPHSGRAPTDRQRRAIVVTRSVPGHDVGFAKSGHAHYFAAFLTGLRAAGYDVTLAVMTPRVDFLALSLDVTPYRITGPAFRTARGTLRVARPDVAAFAVAWAAYARLPRALQGIGSHVRSIVRLSRGYSHVLGTFIRPADERYVQALVERERPDVVISDGLFNVCRRLGDIPHWVLTHEVKHQRAQSFSARGVAVSPAGFDAENERSILDEVGNLIAIQWDDERELRRLCPTARVVVFPVPVAVPKRPRSVRARAQRCIFVGSGSFHNLDGIGWFLDACWPLIRRALPDAALDIYGTVGLRLTGLPAGARVCGVVADLTLAYDGAALAIVPLRIGSGLKVKLVEALAHGLPVVTTSVGAQGLADLTPAPFMVADADAAFAAACCTLMSERPAADALSGRAVQCAQRFEPARAFAPIAAAMLADRAVRATEAPRKPTPFDAIPTRVCIAIPTFRRVELLAALLNGVAAQVIDRTNVHIEILVLDNDPAGSARAVVLELKAALGLPLSYEVVAEAGLAAVRNRALALARQCDFIAMLDDDELPDPHWLQQLLRVARETRAGVVVGPVFPVLGAGAPAWIGELRGRETPLAADGALLSEGWSCNALVALAAVDECGVAFDPALNFAGGEDQLFFRQLAQQGVKIAFAREAVVRERIAPERLRIRFNLQRAFRRGNSLAFCEVRLKPGPTTAAIRALKAAAVIGIGLARLPLALLGGQSAVVLRACEIARGCGMLGALAGKLYLAYQRPCTGNV